MSRSGFLSAVFTKRGVILALVVGVAVLGAGFGFLPGLLGDDADDGPPGEPPRRDGTTETTSESPGATTTAESDGETPPTATTDSGDGTSASGGTDEGATTEDGTTERETTDEIGSDDATADGPAEVGVQAESNATASSLTRAGVGG